MALVKVAFTLDVPESTVEKVLADAEVDPEANYEAACLAVQDWADEQWPHRLDWITSTADVYCEDV